MFLFCKYERDTGHNIAQKSLNGPLLASYKSAINPLSASTIQRELGKDKQLKRGASNKLSGLWTWNTKQI